MVLSMGLVLDRRRQVDRYMSEKMQTNQVLEVGIYFWMPCNLLQLLL